MILKIDLKVKTNMAERWPPLSWTTFVWTIFLYSAYQRRYSSASIKMGHGIYIYTYIPWFIKSVEIPK